MIVVTNKPEIARAVAEPLTSGQNHHVCEGNASKMAGDREKG